MKSRAPCAVFSASMGSFLGCVPKSRGPPGTPSASSPRPQPHQDGGRGAAAGPGLRLRAVRLPSSGSSRDMALERDPRGSPKGRRLRAPLDGGSGAGLSSAPPQLLLTRGPDAPHHALGGPARRPPPRRARSASRRPRARENFLCRGRAGSSERAGSAGGRLPGEERRRGRARRACLVFQRDESPRAALLRRRPPPPVAFPPSGRALSPLGGAAAPSKHPRRPSGRNRSRHP